MSCFYYVTFHRKPTDPEWEKKYAAVVALHEAGVSELPKELADYFGCESANPYDAKEALRLGAVDVGYGSDDSKMLSGVKRCSYYGETGVEIDLDKLPKDVRLLTVAISR